MSATTTVVTAAKDYLATRRSLGFDLVVEGAELLRFARFADEDGHRGHVTTELAIRWATLPKDASSLYRARRLDVVRRFCKFRRFVDPETEIPPEQILGPSHRSRPSPYIYSEEELTALRRAALDLGPPHGLRPHTYSTLFGLLGCTGLRISEALRLTIDDVDLAQAVLIVRASKHKRSRLVPVRESTTESLRQYSQRRDRRHPGARSRAFFLTERATSLKYHRTLMVFISLRKKLEWTGRNHGRHPRIHDLRHTFACRTLLRWYAGGADIDRMMPALATYLGHAKVTDTYWYLSAVPELLAIAGARFEAAAEQGGMA